MAPKLLDGSLYKYPELPPFEKVNAISPNLDELIYELASSVPEYGFWTDQCQDKDGKTYELEAKPGRRAVAQILKLFYRDLSTKEPYSSRKILWNIMALQIGIRSRLEQIKGSQVWNEHRLVHDQAEELRVEEAKESMLSEGTPSYLGHLIQKPFIASPEEFAASRRTLSKTIQMVMSNPTEQFVLNNNDTCNQDEVNQLIFDPLQISDRQLEGLGITMPWISGKLKGLDRVHFKADSIGNLKKRLPTVRILGEQGKSDRFGRHRLYGSSDGHVLGITNINHHPSLYSGKLKDISRRQKHVLNGYSPETHQLVRYISYLKDLIKKISKDWQHMKTSDELNEAKSQLTKIMDEMKNVHNEDKIAAKGLIELLSTLESTYVRTVREKGQSSRQEVSTRLNPGAKLTQINKAVRSLEKRLGSIPKIIRYNANDGAQIEQEIGLHEAIPFQDLLNYLEEKDLNISEKDERQGLQPQQFEKVIMRLLAWKEKFKAPLNIGQYLFPYQAFCELVCQALDRAVSVCTNEFTTMADLKYSLKNLKGILEMQRFWKDWEDLYDRHLGNDHRPYFAQLLSDLNGMEKRLDAIELGNAMEIIKDKYLDAILRLVDCCNSGIRAIKENNEEVAEQSRKAAKREMHVMGKDVLLRTALAMETDTSFLYLEKDF